MKDAERDQNVAVVVIGCNEGDRLLRCLKSIKQSNWPSGALELVYVDSASTDQSVERARMEGARVIETGRRGAASARNLGWRATDARWVLFVDGDTVLAPDFLRHAFSALEQDHGLACVWGHRQEAEPEQSLFVRVLDLDWRYPPGETLFCGGDALFRRSALEVTDGFDDTLKAGEEPELCYRLRKNGWRILHIDVPMTLHDLPIVHFGQYWQRAVRAGYAYAAVSARTGRLWQAEVRHSLHMAALVAMTPLASAIAGVCWGMAAALIPWSALFALMVRSSWRARWRSNNVLTLFCYGVHSWIEQIPVAWGICRYQLDRWQRRSQPLIDYK